MAVQIQDVNGGLPITANSTFVITGSGFGNTQGYTALELVGVAYISTINSWSDTSIECVAAANLPDATSYTCVVSEFGNPIPEVSNVRKKENAGGYVYPCEKDSVIETQLNVDDTQVPNTDSFSTYPAHISFRQFNPNVKVVESSATTIKFSGLDAVPLRRQDGTVLQFGDLSESYRSFDCYLDSNPNGAFYRVGFVINSVETITVSGLVENLGTEENPVIHVPPQTSAGLLAKAYLTADLVTDGGAPASTFFQTSTTDKGLVLSQTQQVTVDDGETEFYTFDWLGEIETAEFVTPAGFFAGKLSVLSDQLATYEFGVEVYRAASNGTALPSGVTGAPVGDLGVTIIGQLNSVDIEVYDAEQVIDISGFLSEEVTLLAGERFRLHYFATKKSTAGGNRIASIFSGVDHESFIQVPVTTVSVEILNNYKDVLYNYASVPGAPIGYLYVFCPNDLNTQEGATVEALGKRNTKINPLVVVKGGFRDEIFISAGAMATGTGTVSSPTIKVSVYQVLQDSWSLISSYDVPVLNPVDVRPNNDLSGTTNKVIAALEGLNLDFPETVEIGLVIEHEVGDDKINGFSDITVAWR